MPARAHVYDHVTDAGPAANGLPVGDRGGNPLEGVPLGPLAPGAALPEGGVQMPGVAQRSTGRVGHGSGGTGLDSVERRPSVRAQLDARALVAVRDQCPDRHDGRDERGRPPQVALPLFRHASFPVDGHLGFRALPDTARRRPRMAGTTRPSARCQPSLRNVQSPSASTVMRIVPLGSGTSPRQVPISLTRYSTSPARYAWTMKLARPECRISTTVRPLFGGTSASTSSPRPVTRPPDQTRAMLSGVRVTVPAPSASTRSAAVSSPVRSLSSTVPW